MSDNNEKKESVYGENHPAEEDTKREPGIREEVAEGDKNRSTAEDLEQTRQEQAQATSTGGMGRNETPQTEATQGGWSRPGEE